MNLESKGDFTKKSILFIMLSNSILIFEYVFSEKGKVKEKVQEMEKEEKEIEEEKKMEKEQFALTSP